MKVRNIALWSSNILEGHSTSETMSCNSLIILDFVWAVS